MKKNKKIKSRVKRVQLAQKRSPLRPEEYKKQLSIARRVDFFRVLIKIIVILLIIFAALYAAANIYMKKNYNITLIQCRQEAKQTVAKSKPDDFRLAETSYVYGSNGKKLAELSSDTDATYLKYDKIPENVVNAFIAVEDRTFWKNSGIDTKGIIRVLGNYVVTRGDVAEGASTITQQLARSVFLSQEKTLSRKVREIYIARDLAKKYSKQQIMEFYCNNVCFANGIYGVEDAAQTYFHKSVDQLDLSQIAYICAIPNRPEYYNPYNNSKNAIPRRNKILKNMYECGSISKKQYEKAVTETIHVRKKAQTTEKNDYETTYAVNCAVRYLMEMDGFNFKYKFKSTKSYNNYMKTYNEQYSQEKHKLYTGGYRIYTTIDESMQKKMQNILDKNLSFSSETDDSGIYALQGAMTVIDNKTGKVVAIIGGRHQSNQTGAYSLNRAYQSYRQPGSTFKPLVVYTPALERGYSQYSTLRNIDVSTAKYRHSGIGSMSGEAVTLRNAVERSLNGCAYWLFNRITPKYGLSHVINMQFSRISPSDYTMSAALGGLTYGTTTVEMANAYSTLENHGEYTQTDCIKKLVDRDGNNIYSKPQSKRVYKKGAADNMTNVMMGVISDGTAKDMNWDSSSNTDAAGKTGTTNGSKDGWFCGYTPYYTISVWVGYDRPRTLSNLYGATYPAEIWKSAMLNMLKGKPSASFILHGRTYSSSSSSSSDSDTDSSSNSTDYSRSTGQTTERRSTSSGSSSTGTTTDNSTGTSQTGGSTGSTERSTGSTDNSNSSTESRSSTSGSRSTGNSTNRSNRSSTGGSSRNSGSSQRSNGGSQRRNNGGSSSRNNGGSLSRNNGGSSRSNTTGEEGTTTTD